MSKVTAESPTDYMYTSDEDIEKLGKLLIDKKAPCIISSLQGFYTAKICETRGVSPRRYDEIVLEEAEKLNDVELVLFQRITELMWQEISDGLPSGHFVPIYIIDKKKGPLVEEWIIGFIKAANISPKPWAKLYSHQDYGKLYYYFLLILYNEKNTDDKNCLPPGGERGAQEHYGEIYEMVQTYLPIVTRQFYKYFQRKPFEMDDTDIILKQKNKSIEWS